MMFLDFLRKLNLFESGSDDVAIIRHERLSTRLYLVLMFVFIVGLIIYAALLSRTIIVTVPRPTEYEYKQLFDQYSDILTCPCSSISIRYHEFIRAQVTFHEVCQSQFITQEWIEEIYSANVTFIPVNDIRTIISAYWQFVRFFCNLSNDILNDVYTNFDATLLLTPTVQSPTLLETKTIVSFNFSLSSAVNSFRRNFLIVRSSTIGNGLFSGLATDYYPYLAGDWSQQYGGYFLISSVSFEDGCSCSSLTGCPQPIGIFSTNETSNWTRIPGMVFDCLILDGTLASSLECFYDTECLSLIEVEIPINISVEPLHMQSRFAHNTTLQTLLDELMIEQLSTVINFSLYYTQCNPDYCTYSYSRRFDALYIVTLTLSAFGGISTILRLLVIALLSVISRIYAWRIRRRAVGDVQQSTNQNRLPTIEFRTLFNSMRNLLVDLNLFRSSSQEVEILHRQRIITRVFIVCLAICLVVTSLYSFLSTQTKIFTVLSPSRTDYERLLELYSDSIQCPCSQLVISYSDFIEIVPTFHQVCSSEIILPEWYNHFTPLPEIFLYDYFYFPNAFGAKYFQTLSTFCILANNTVADAYRVFSASTFISSRLFSEAIFAEQAKALTDTFTLSTKNEFIRIFSLARYAIQINQLGSRSFSNFRMDPNVDDTEVDMHENLLQHNPSSNPQPGDTCSCLSEGVVCGYLTHVYNSSIHQFPIFLVDLIVKCLPTESALASALECWYDEDCSSTILASYAMNGVLISNDTLPLNFNDFSRFSKNATMEVMMNELLIENWTITTSYDQFFNKCAPASCVYNIQERFDLLFVIVTIIGIYKSLTEGFRLLLPIIVRAFLFILQRIRMRSSVANQSITTDEVIHGRAFAVAQMIRFRQYIYRCNLFETPSSTIHTRQREIISTRVYLCLLIASIATLIFYTGFIERTQSETIHNPSQSTYESLQSTYSDTVQCPCSNISISYESFTVHLNSSYHPICLSDFISSRWFTYFRLYNSAFAWWLEIKDFRKWGILYFQLLQSFCSLANFTVDEAIKQFQTSSFITSEVIPQNQFIVQVNEILGSFQKSISTVFTRPLQIFRASAQGNALLSLLGTNWQPNFGIIADNAHLLSIPVTYNNGTCSCATSSSCIEPAAIYNLSSAKVYILNDFFIGCLTLDSILLSSLSCLFSNSCIYELMGAMNAYGPGGELYITLPTVSSLLLLPSQSRFKINDTIETLVNQLFIDTWSNETSYERYYSACAPSSCTYSYNKRFNVLYIITTFLSIFSGLSMGLHFVVRLIMRIAYRTQTLLK